MEASILKKIIKWVGCEENYPEADGYSDEYRKPLINYIREHGLCFSGSDHQNRKNGAPLFDDGKKLFYSQRGWGDMMYEAWKHKFDDADDPMGYCIFAFCMPERIDAVFPV